LHGSCGREVSKEQFNNGESLLVPSSDSEDGASQTGCCDTCGLSVKRLHDAGSYFTSRT